MLLKVSLFAVPVEIEFKYQFPCFLYFSSEYVFNLPFMVHRILKRKNHSDYFIHYPYIIYTPFTPILI